MALKEKYHLYTESCIVGEDDFHTATIRKEGINIVCTEAYEEEFFCSAHIKWDGCSHFNMADYRHVCGVESYAEFLQILWFCHQVGMLDHEHKMEEEEIKEFEKNPIFADMRIVKIKEWNEEDERIFEEYKK